MPKDDDFGGLPETVFVNVVKSVQAGVPLGLTAPDQVAILAAIAVAEHLSAKSGKVPNMGDYTILSLKIDNKIEQIRTQGGPKGSDIADLLTLITDYQNLWA